MQWVLQWGGYLFKKTLYDLPAIILSVGAIIFVVGVLVGGVKGLQTILRTSIERKNVISLL
jgi:hypothetical protein